MFAAVVAAGSLLFAAQTTPDEGLAQDLDEYISRAMATGMTPGLAVAVVSGDAVIYSNDSGFADRENDQRVDLPGDFRTN